MKAILDASPIIAFFEEIASPETLLLSRSLGLDLMVPSAVSVEDITKEPSRGKLDACIADGSIALLAPVDALRAERLERAHPGLGRGEAEVILNGVDIKQADGTVLCVIDEGPGRRIAARMGLPLTGTIGLINKMAAALLIDATQRSSLMAKLQSSTFRANGSLFI